MKALEALGRQPIRYDDGTIVFNARRGSGAYITPTGELRVAADIAAVEATAIKQAYAAQCVAAASAQFGWHLQQTDASHLVLTRRR
jgi:hypothetical protein